MTTPARQEIIDAHKTLEYLIKNLYDIPLEEAKHTTSYERLAKFLPPKPQPTMAEIEWDDEKHYLAEAEHCSLGKVVMLSKICGGEEIYYIRQGFKGELLTFASPGKLTPTGRRYVLQEGE